jgi:hypothetical protein
METPLAAPRAPSFRRLFERHLRAGNRWERTVRTYLNLVDQVERFLAARGLSLTDAGRRDLEAFLGYLLSCRKASTVATYHVELAHLGKAVEDGYLAQPGAVVNHHLGPEAASCCPSRTGVWPDANTSESACTAGT